MSTPFNTIEVEMDKMVKIVIGFITASPTATGVSIFDAAVKVSLSIQDKYTYFCWVDLSIKDAFFLGILISNFPSLL